jgi:hypothetical protein
MMPAWRALPAGVGGAVESISNAMQSFMTAPVMTPADAAAKLVQIGQGLIQAAVQAGIAGNPSAIGDATSQVVSLTTTNVTLTTAWTTASAAPGGQPAANTAYTEGIKAAAGAAAASVFSAIGGMADIHMCPIPVPVPPHGPGMVTKASTTVEINGLPACRMDDKVFEACGGADPILGGCPTVEIDDQVGSGGASELSIQGQSQPTTSPDAPVPVQALVAEQAYADAAYYGTGLIDRGPACQEV